MKLADALTKYRGYRQDLVDQERSIFGQLENAKKKAEVTGDSAWAEQAATLQLSLDETEKKFRDNQEVLDSLIEQHCAAWNLEVAKQQADPENGIAATMGKMMTVVARMCAGDKVPMSDEKKLMEYNSEMYAKAKQAQTIMATLKERRKEYESLWDDEEEGRKYDPQSAADNTEAAGVLPEIPESEPVSQIPETNIDE